MAIKYGFNKDMGERPVVETTRIQAVFDGHHFSQYPMAEGTGVLENGMLVTVDHIEEVVAKPKAASDKVYLHASVEKLYNGEGRNAFFLREGAIPRVYDLREGDKFETNAIIWDDADFADFSAIREALKESKLVAQPDTSGYIKISKGTGDAETDQKLVVTKAIRLPNGQPGVEISL